MRFNKIFKEYLKEEILKSPPQIEQSKRKILLPEGIIILKDREFFHNTKLISVLMPNSVKEIGEECFASCRNLESIGFSKRLLKIKDSAFENCENLKEINIPESTIFLGRKCFKNDINLEKVSLSRNLKTLSDKCFAGCKFEEIEIPNSVIFIGRKCFKDCIYLKKIHLSGNYEFKEISSKCFSGCSALRFIIIPEPISRIKYSAFENCINLEEILILGKINFTNFFDSFDDVFSECKSLHKIYCMKKSTYNDLKKFSKNTSVEIVYCENVFPTKIYHYWDELNTTFSPN